MRKTVKPFFFVLMIPNSPVEWQQLKNKSRFSKISYLFEVKTHKKGFPFICDACTSKILIVAHKRQTKKENIFKCTNMDSWHQLMTR
jgi:hypothetical protein